MEEFINDINWVSNIKNQLNERDHRDKIPFEPISKSYLKILEENTELSKRNSELQQALLKYKTENWRSTNLNSENVSLNSSINNMTTNNTSLNKNISNNNIDITNLKNENESLKKELMDVYRLKKENEEALSRLKKQSIENEELIIKRGQNLDEFSKKYEELNNNYELVSEMNIKLKGNLKLLNTESIELRKAHDTGLEQLEKYKNENRRLTEHLIKLKENQMDSLNEWQNEYEKYRKLNKNINKNRLRSSTEIDMSYIKTNNNFNNNNNMIIKNKSSSESQTNSPANKDNSKKGWSIGNIFKGKDSISSLFGSNNTKDNNNKSKKTETKVNDDDFFISKGPKIDLFGPSLFNVTPPQLKSNMWQAHGDEVCKILFDGAGKKIISGGNDKIIKIWNQGSGMELYSLRGCEGSIIDLIESPNRLYIAAGGNDCKIHLWSTKTQRHMRVYNGHTNKVTSICISSDSKKLFSGSHDRTIKIWDIESASCRYTISAQSGVNHLNISPDEYYLATAHLDGNIRFFSWRDKKELFALKDHGKSQTNGIIFSPPDGYNIITSSKDGKIILWDLRKQRKLNEIDNKLYKNTTITGHPIFSPDGKWIIGGSTLKDIKTNKYPIFIWNAKDLKFKHCLHEHKYAITNVIWNGRGGVASCDRGGNIATWC